MNQITENMIENWIEMSNSEDSDTAQVGKLFLKWIFRGEKAEVKQ